MIRDPRSSPTIPIYSGYNHHSQQQQHSPYLRRVSPPGSPAAAPPRKKCCYEPHRDKTTTLMRSSSSSATNNETTKESIFCCCYTCPNGKTTSVLATIGVCCLVLGYTIFGAFIFMTLEGGLQQHFDTAVAASKSNLPTKTNANGPAAATTPTTTILTKNDNKGGTSTIGDLRTETVDRLWSITENLNILYRENWTRLAAEEVLLFQEALFKTLRNGGGGRGGGVGGARYLDTKSGTLYYHQHLHKWSFSSSFLYSLTLITTIGEFYSLILLEFCPF